MYVMTISVDDLFDSITANQMSLYDTIWSYAEDAVNHNGTVLIQQIYANAKPDLIERIQTLDQLMNAKQKYDEIYLKIQH